MPCARCQIIEHNVRAWRVWYPVHQRRLPAYDHQHRTVPKTVAVPRAGRASKNTVDRFVPPTRIVLATNAATVDHANRSADVTTIVAMASCARISSAAPAVAPTPIVLSN